MPRDVLPQRRGGETVQFRHWNMDFCATTGHYQDGRLGEVFLSGGKLTSQAATMAEDAAIAISLALQYGCPVAVLRHAFQRKAAPEPGVLGEPVGPLARLMDLLEQKP